MKYQRCFEIFEQILKFFKNSLFAYSSQINFPNHHVSGKNLGGGTCLPQVKPVKFGGTCPHAPGPPMTEGEVTKATFDKLYVEELTILYVRVISIRQTCDGDASGVDRRHPSGPHCASGSGACGSSRREARDSGALAGDATPPTLQQPRARARTTRKCRRSSLMRFVLKMIKLLVNRL